MMPFFPNSSAQCAILLYSPGFTFINLVFITSNGCVTIVATVATVFME